MAIHTRELMCLMNFQLCRASSINRHSTLISTSWLMNMIHTAHKVQIQPRRVLLEHALLTTVLSVKIQSGDEMTYETPYENGINRTLQPRPPQHLMGFDSSTTLATGVQDCFNRHVDSNTIYNELSQPMHGKVFSNSALCLPTLNPARIQYTFPSHT
jgi:hypothetical protein